MKVWIPLLVAWYALLAAGYLALRDADSSGASAPSPDWERAALCLWEHDFQAPLTLGESTRILRFCLTLDPQVYSPPPPTR